MKYAMFGDSHTQVVFPIIGKLLTSMGYDVLSKPVAGWTLKKHLDDGLESMVQSFKPDVLVLSLGGNNSNLTDSYQNDIDEVLRIAKENNVKKVFWVSPAWAIRSDVQKRHEWTTNYLKAHLPKRVRFIDIRPLTKNGHRDDGVHFSTSKYNEWAEYVSNHLLSNFAITQIPKWTWVASGSIVILGLTGMFLKLVKK